MKRATQAVSNRAPGAPPRRGRPRSDKARRAILRATREILDRDGLTAVSIEAVALRAGVGKPTIYRSWPNAQALAMAALMEAAGTVPPPVRRASSGLDALRRQLREIASVFAARTGRSVAIMLAASELDTELAKVFRHHFILARREEGRSFLQQAAKAREIRDDIDLEVALDLIYAPIFYRLLLGRGAVDVAYADTILDHVLPALRLRTRSGTRGAAARPGKSPRSPPAKR